ncbi:MAG: purine-nucleoside phosphorylase [Eubacteriaceae bacterium]|nr:purine-nucleoside phosphorylase [Eubacteriaceae bacterium]MCR4894812.1 purine-nucleoside phosphorylase [Eubacteriales bacterium]
MSTPHNRAQNGDFAKTVLMPGDPLRAKFIADNYLEDAVLVNDVRGMLGFTGYYKGKKVSTMGSGMGIPSISLYAHELYSFYGVENIIRVGTCGGYSKDVPVGGLILAQAACTNSAWTSNYGLPGTYAPISDFGLLTKAASAAKEMGLKASVGNILSSDPFYTPDGEAWKKWAAMGILGVEMESAGLFCTAAYLGKKALSILTVSDHFVLDQADMTADERQTTLDDMIRIALEIAE